MNPTSDVMPSAKVNMSKVIREGCEPNPLERLPPPASSNKPLTPFSIADILGKPSGRPSAHLSSPVRVKHRVTSPGSQTSPLCALQELTSKTFRGLELGVLQAAEGRDGLSVFGQRSNPKKRRKSRTAFTHHQIYELEKRFLRQKYLSPVDRDQVAQQLALTNAQVITWFQNRRAKLKRDMEELKADVESARAVGAVPLEETAALAELEGSATESRGHMGTQWSSQITHELQNAHKLRMLRATSSSFSDHTSLTASEDEDMEIDVDD
ncbi:transcription factor LBX1b [Pangasianodon hypophthalmus]|uniref:transcription factor LBX1b n=1 Tax=Pangasianodon hypophthalmus TaxID=310915 RepID=UPI0023078B9B|nr:transcription factor LBX1b [Pangasianodon hypophthalmus]